MSPSLPLPPPPPGFDGNRHPGDPQRRWFLVLVGVYLFVLGVLYFQTTGGVNQRRGYVAYGGAGAKLGASAVLRVVGYDGKDRSSEAPTDIRLSPAGNGQHGVAQRHGDALHAIFVVKDLPAAMSARVQGPWGEEEASFTVQPAPKVDVQWGEAEAPARARCDGEDTPMVWLLPHGGLWVAGMANEALVRIQPSNAPRWTSARIQWLGQGGDAGWQPIDSLGMGMLQVKLGAGQQTIAFEVQLDESVYHCEVQVQAAPVKMRLSPALSLGKQGSAAAFVATTYGERERVYCEIRQGDAVLWAAAGAAEGHRFAFDVPNPPDGVSSVQCSFHPALPGTAGASGWIVRAGQPDVEASEVLRALGAPSPPNGGIFPTSAALTPTAEAWMGSLARPVLLPWITIFDTAANDAAREAGDLQVLRGRILWLFGAGTLAMGLFMLAEIRRQQRSMRRSYADYAAQMGEDAAPIAEGTLARESSRAQVVAIAVIVALNAIGILMLLDLML